MTTQIELIGGPDDGDTAPETDRGLAQIMRKTSSGTAVYELRDGNPNRYDFVGYESKPA